MKIDSRILNLQENVKQLSDKVLLEQTSYIAEHERRVTILALRHLREVEIRRLYADLECSSMYEYCLKHLKYSENKTISRLASARLMTELPEIEERIQAGALNITNLTKIKSFVRAEKAAQNTLTKDDKLALIASCENKPTRKLAKELIQKSHQPALLAEKFQMTAVVMNDDSLNLEYSKFDALLGPEDKDLLQEFKNLYAHELQDGANITVLKFLLKKAVQFKKKQLGINSPNAPLPLSPKVTPTKKSNPLKKATHQRKPLPVSVKRFVWQRANACCEHFDPKIGKKCQSKFALQTDHIISLALGGTNEVENMRLLCRVHNSRRAVKTFGIRRV